MKLACSAALALSIGAGACATPKVMVDQQFLGDHRTTKLIIQKSTVAADTFDTWVRVCDLSADGMETMCVDTLVLSNVNPASVY